MSSNRKDYVIQRPEISVFSVITSWVPGTTTYKVDVPLGCYYLQLLCNTVDLATSSLTLQIQPYLDAAQTAVGATIPLRPLSSPTSAATATIATGTAAYVIEVNATAALLKRLPILLPFGALVTMAAGTSSGATTLTVQLTAARDA